MDGFVYFIEGCSTKNIKIGFSECPINRMKALQTGSSEQLKLLGCIEADRDREGEIHNYFKHQRLHGEWFKSSKQLKLFIDGNISKKLFGEEYFKAWSRCDNIYKLSGQHSGDLRTLTDHGFIADAACVWGGEPLNGHEFAIVSRTYAPDDLIDNPPTGIKCVRLPSKELMGQNDYGTVIATVIVEVSETSKQCLALFHRVPVDMFPFVVPMYFHDEYFIVLQPGRYFSEAVFVKK